MPIELSGPGFMTTFECNVCGRRNTSDLSTFSREEGHCLRCKSTVRMRSVIYALSLALFESDLAIPQFPKSPSTRGLGLSDWLGYASRLKKIFSYSNTFLHHRPRLDITNVPEKHWAGYDFLLSVDVFEHVLPPVSKAFAGAFRLLKTGGALVLALPYTPDQTTTEHFPRLHDFKIMTLFGKTCLINKRSDGHIELYDEVFFHGGKGATLEMRRFGFGDILSLLHENGFDLVTAVPDVPSRGIHYNGTHSHTLLARKR